ncbi:MAG: hypothetical protein ACKO0Z_25075 [Betaproteobacteria bacterium]
MRLGAHDGQGLQAQIILAILHHDDRLTYGDLADSLEVYPYFNGRERGYSLNLRYYGGQDLHVLFYEYRSTDSIIVDSFAANLMNPPTVADYCEQVEGGELVSKSFPAESYHEAAKYIVKTVRAHVYGEEDDSE